MNNVSDSASGRFHDRADVDRCAAMIHAAHGAGWIDDQTSSVIMHDLGRMRARLAMLHAAFPDNALHALAVKANPVVEVLREAVACGVGLEAASMEEVYLALAADCPPERIVFDSPAKTSAEIGEAVRRGILINANSFNELQRIDAELLAQPTTSKIGLRINPDVGSGTIAHTSVANQASKFGVALDAHRQRIVHAFQRYRWLSGLHVHVGSQGCSLEMLVEAVAKANALRQEIESSTLRALDFMDIGGGLPAVYRSEDRSPAPKEYADRLKAVVNDLFDDGPRIVTEFGRCVQAGCGLTFSRVEYVQRDSSTAIIHVGADLLLRPVYASNDWKHEYFVLDEHFQPKTANVECWNLAGPLCFSGDVIGRNVSLPRIAPGDWIVIRDTGAYTLSMWSRHCSRSIPLVLGYDADAAEPFRLLRAAESPAYLAAFWSSDPTAVPSDNRAGGSVDCSSRQE